MFERKFALSGIWTHVPPKLVGCDHHHTTMVLQDNHAGNTAIEESEGDSRGQGVDLPGNFSFKVTR